MSRKAKILSVVVLFWLTVYSALPCLCLERVTDPQAAPASSLRLLDKKILLKSIELQKLTANFEKSRAQKYKLRKWIDFAGQQTSAAGFFAATVVGTQQTGGNLNTPLKINVDTLANGLNAGIVGSTIGASASATQLGLDGLRFAYNVKKGLGPGDVSRKFVTGLEEFNAMIVERRKLIDSDPELKASQVVEVEHNLLEFRRDLICTDFIGTFTHENNRNVSQDIYYGLDVSRNVTAAIATDFLKKGLKQPRFNEPGFAWLLTSAGITIGAPWISTACGKSVSRFSAWRLKKKLDFNQKTTIDDLLAARKHLREAISQSGADMPVPGVPLLTATEMLDSSHGDFQKRIAALMDTRSKLNRVSFQQKLASGAIGGQLLAFGILGEAGWQKYGKNFRIRDFNKALFAGNITGVTATSMALGATGFAAVAGEVNEWKMRKAYTRPEDLLADHLVSLDTLEAQVLKIGD